MVGYGCYEGMATAEKLARLYGPVRLLLDAFQPSFKRAEKTRDGARVTKPYHKQPSDRLLTDLRVGETTRARIVVLRANLGPVRLLARHRRRGGCQRAGSAAPVI